MCVSFALWCYVIETVSERAALPGVALLVGFYFIGFCAALHYFYSDFTSLLCHFASAVVSWLPVELTEAESLFLPLNEGTEHVG